MIGIKIEGLDRIASNALGLMKEVEDLNLKATDESLKALVISSRTRAPYDTGSLRRSIDKRITKVSQGSVEGQYGSDLPYALITELGGTIPAHKVEAKNRKSLAWKGSDGNTAFAKSVMIPAQHRSAKPYLFPALIENMEGILWRYRKAYEMIKDRK